MGAGGRRWQLKKTAHIIRFWLDCSMAFGFSGGCALVLPHFSIKVHYFLVFIGIGFISVLNGGGGQLKKNTPHYEIVLWLFAMWLCSSALTLFNQGSLFSLSDARLAHPHTQSL